MEKKRTCGICGEDKIIDEFPTPKNNICVLCANIRNRTFIGLEESLLSPEEKQITRNILRALGYVPDSDKTIYQQFLERHPELKK